MATVFSPANSSESMKCDRHYTEKNHTTFIYGGYGGIPENLLLNIIIWVLLLLLFSLVRKIAWDYGRIALVSRAEARPLINTVNNPAESPNNVWTALFYGDNAGDCTGSQESLDTVVHRQDTGFCSWIPAFFRLKDQHILEKCGGDAVQYIKFQRYLLVYMAIITVLSIGVILPCNFQGNLEGTKKTFGHTTISNINSTTPILWVHAIFAVIYLILAIIFMRHFSVNTEYQEHDQATRTLMVFNIPKDKCYKNLIMQHFQEAYPDITVQDVQFAYNISQLAELDKSRQQALEGLMNSEQLYKQTGERPQMMPIYCGACCQMCHCKCCKEEVDCIEYYTEQEQELSMKVDTEKVQAFKSTLGIAFVTFESDMVAANVHKDFKMSCKGAHNPMPSSISRDLSVQKWQVRYAPAFDNICWENLSTSPAFWWMKAVLVNSMLFVLLFFMTTPSMFLNLLNLTNYKADLEATIHSAIIVQFVPTLLLLLMSSLLPNLVYYTDHYFIRHWTRSAEHHAVMRKTFIFLLLMVLVLPSLGLTSAKALVDWLSQKDKGAYTFRWQCIFIPDNGAFFVNYVITSAFIGTAVQLVRIPDLLVCAIRMLFAKSVAERTSIRKVLVSDYNFGMQYAWMLCVFSVTITYSIPCPLITPFGLVYLIMKHMVDRYNIFFAYTPSKIDKNIHASAINFVIVAVILLQFAVVFFTLLRAGSNIDDQAGSQVRGVAIFSVVSLLCTMILFFGRICFGCCRALGPVAYKKVNTGGEEEDSDSDQKFIAPVLAIHNTESNSHHGNNAVTTDKSYGTIETEVQPRSHELEEDTVPFTL